MGEPPGFTRDRVRPNADPSVGRRVSCANLVDACWIEGVRRSPRRTRTRTSTRKHLESRCPAAAPPRCNPGRRGNRYWGASAIPRLRMRGAAEPCRHDDHDRGLTICRARTTPRRTRTASARYRGADEPAVGAPDPAEDLAFALAPTESLFFAPDPALAVTGAHPQTSFLSRAIR
jgi:hypothetical protein